MLKTKLMNWLKELCELPAPVDAQSAASAAPAGEFPALPAAASEMLPAPAADSADTARDF